MSVGTVTEGTEVSCRSHCIERNAAAIWRRSVAHRRTLRALNRNANPLFADVRAIQLTG